MDAGFATVIAAAVTTVGGLIGLAIKEFRAMKNANKRDHGQVMKRLDKVQHSVDHVAERLDDHIDWHLKK